MSVYTFGVQSAIATPFDNSTNGFTSQEVQSAIEEAKQNAEGFPRAGIPFSYNGSVGANVFLGVTELISSPRWVFPQNIRITEFSWTNTSTNLGAFRFEFYKNGQAAGNLIYTYTPSAAERTAGFSFHIFPTNLTFNAGDVLYVRHIRTNTPALSDAAFILWIARIP